jgi:hypothetical protein
LDLAGNVNEWVHDWYLNYPDIVQQNPKGSESGEIRAVRGGSCFGGPDTVRNAKRAYVSPPDNSGDDIGFRCISPLSKQVAEPKPTKSTTVEVTPYPEMIVKFSDDFSDPSDDWNPGEYEGVKISFYNGGYRFEILKKDWFYRDPINTEFIDVAVEVDVENLGKDDNATGITCRDIDQRNFYLFQISNNGSFSIWKIIDNEWQSLKNWEKSIAIKTGKSRNRLKAVCVGNNLSLFVNEVFVASVKDEELSEGLVGLFAGSYDKTPVDVVFDNFTVYQLTP